MHICQIRFLTHNSYLIHWLLCCCWLWLFRRQMVWQIWVHVSKTNFWLWLLCHFKGNRDHINSYVSAWGGWKHYVSRCQSVYPPLQSCWHNIFGKKNHTCINISVISRNGMQMKLMNWFRLKDVQVKFSAKMWLNVLAACPFYTFWALAISCIVSSVQPLTKHCCYGSVQWSKFNILRSKVNVRTLGPRYGQ